MLLQIKTYLRTHQTLVFRLIFVSWCVFELVRMCFRVFPLSDVYERFVLSDWMINYQAGFVRRGLWGELLFQLYQWHPFPPRTVISTIMIITFIILIFLLVYLFKKNSWSFILLPSCALVPYAMALWGLCSRKDYILLLGAFLMFSFYRNWLIGRRCMLNYVGLQIVGILLMLTHEASMFFTIPILFCHLLGFKRRKTGVGFVRSALKACVFFLPVIVAWLAVCVCKGNSDMANAIWASWKPAMEAYPIPSEEQGVGYSIAWLGHTFLPTAKFHLGLNFGGNFIWIIPSLPFTLYCYVAIYYVVTRMNRVNLHLNTIKPIDNVLLSNIVIIQFVFMLPMFTVLSTDGVRIVPYWIVSSLFIFHFFSSQNFPLSRRLTVFSKRIQKWMDGKPLLNNPWFYLVIITTIPLACYGHADYRFCIPLYAVVYLLQHLVGF